MKRNTVLAIGLSAGFLFVAPVAAFAAESPTPSTTPSPAKTTTAGEDGPMTRITRQLTVSPGRAHPGDRIKLDFACQTRPETPAEKVSVVSAAFDVDLFKTNFAVVKDVKPGRYKVTLHCGPETSTASLAVLAKPTAPQPPKQVVKVPTGAPQTGGTDGPQDSSSAVEIGAAGLGVVALGGAGIALGRRRRVNG